MFGRTLEELLETPIWEMATTTKLSVRATNCLLLGLKSLVNTEVLKLKDLIVRTDKELLAIRNLGRKSLKEIKQKVDSYAPELVRIHQGDIAHVYDGCPFCAKPLPNGLPEADKEWGVLCPACNREIKKTRRWLTILTPADVGWPTTSPTG